MGRDMKTDGGPVFPQQSQPMTCKQMGDGTIATYPIGEPLFKGGMSLRDYFAAAALQLIGGLYASDEWEIKADPHKTFGQQVAEQAYLLADAMLAERKRD